MSAAGAFAQTSSIVKKTFAVAGFGLSLLFSNAAQAGSTLYDQCLVFVLDSSQSTKPLGWEGQVHGIAAGMRDGEVRSKINKMQTGMNVYVIGFSSKSDAKIMHQALLKDAGTAEKFSIFMDKVPAPYDGNNDLLGALTMAHNVFKAIEAKGDECEMKTVDFSGDGGDYYAPHETLQQAVRDMAKDQITIHGFSFVDARYKKYLTRDASAWHAGDKNKFDDIHDYYEKVIVTPAGAGTRPGRHYKVVTDNTGGWIQTQFVELMRDKVRFEVASREDIQRARFTRALPKQPYNIAYNLK